MQPENPQFRQAGGESKHIGQCLCGLTASSKEPIYVVDILNDPRCTLNECKQMGIISFAAIPLLVGNEVVGVLGLASFSSLNFSAYAASLEVIAVQIAMSLRSDCLRREMELLISELEATNYKLQQEYSFRSSIIELAADGICVCHEIIQYPYVRFTVWNRCMQEITGYSKEEINRLGWYQTVYPDKTLQDKAIERMNRMRRGDDLRDEEWEIVRADGQKRIVNYSTSVVLTEDKATHVLAVMHDVTSRKSAEDSLRRAHCELLEKHAEAERANIALKVLLEQREKDKQDLQEAVLANVKLLVSPHLENLKKTQLSDIQRIWAEHLEKSMNQIVSPYIKRLTENFLNLTPTEIRIAEMIKNGLRTKEIADLLAVAPSTVRSHRESMRCKLALKGKKINLASCLRNFE
jgi:PAS domain S-box-containing protein